MSGAAAEIVATLGAEIAGLLPVLDRHGLWTLAGFGVAGLVVHLGQRRVV